MTTLITLRYEAAWWYTRDVLWCCILRADIMICLGLDLHRCPQPGAFVGSNGSIN